MKRIIVFFLIGVFAAALNAQVIQSSKSLNYDVVYQSGAVMNVKRMGQYSLKLPNGNIILIGGHGTQFVSLNTSEIYNPTSKTFSIDTMQYIHDYASVTELNDGTWLIAGGAYDLGVAPGITGAEIYNPATNSFTACNSMINPRMESVGTRLKNNNVLIVGGWYDATSATYGELFDYNAKTFNSTQALITPRSNPMVIATYDSGAVVFGGYYYYGGTNYETVEYYNPKTNSFTQIQDHLFPNDSGWTIQNDLYMRPMSSQLMKDGKYLISAFKPASSTSSPAEYCLATFDPATKQFSKLALNSPLPSTDSVTFFGSPIIDTLKNAAYWLGSKLNTGVTTYSVFQLYVIDLNKMTLQATKEYTTNYFWSSASMTLLNDGRILVAGGTTSNDYYTNFNPVDSTIIISIYAFLDDIKASSSGKTAPNSYSLNQNYPNPFNPSTIISYQTPRDGMITLKIYDMLGREIKTLVNEFKTKGTYSVNFDASGLASGVYIYQIKAGEFSALRKMVLMK